jgi:aspartate oxidase
MSDRHPMTGNEMSGSEAGGLERHQYDVVVVGAGGAGLRAAIAAHDAGARTAIVCKSLLGKAHTVMAEGGIVAVTSVAVSEGQMTSTNASVLVAGGALTVLVCPLLAQRLLVPVTRIG